MDIPTDSCLSRDRPPRRPPAHPPSSQDSPAGCLCPRHTAVEVVNCAPDGCWRQGPGPQRPRSPAVQRGHLLPTDSTWPQRSQDLPPAPQRPEQDRTGALGPGPDRLASGGRTWRQHALTASAAGCLDRGAGTTPLPGLARTSRLPLAGTA